MHVNTNQDELTFCSQFLTTFLESHEANSFISTLNDMQNIMSQVNVQTPYVSRFKTRKQNEN